MIDAISVNTKEEKLTFTISKLALKIEITSDFHGIGSETISRYANVIFGASTPHVSSNALP
jgi:hypothetical protein